ncbi:MAG: hypothetical protein ACLGIN_00095 [Candidatus Sericytochromatia bacterium]
MRLRPLALAVLIASCGLAAPADASPWKFVFWAYDRLPDEERRVLEASRLTACDAPPMSGKALYDHLAKHDQKVLANYLNTAAVLASKRFGDRTALSYLVRAERLTINHVYAEVDPALKTEVERASAPYAAYGKRFVGPEVSSFLHGHYDVAFRENRPYTSLQYSFSSKHRFAKVDFDLDEECPGAGDVVATIQHMARVAGHGVMRMLPGEQAGRHPEPGDFFKRLRAAVHEPLGRGLRPSYDLASEPEAENEL